MVNPSDRHPSNGEKPPALSNPFAQIVQGMLRREAEEATAFNLLNDAAQMMEKRTQLGEVTRQTQEQTRIEAITRPIKIAEDERLNLWQERSERGEGTDPADVWSASEAKLCEEFTDYMNAVNPRWTAAQKIAHSREGTDPRTHLRGYGVASVFEYRFENGGYSDPIRGTSLPYNVFLCEDGKLRRYVNAQATASAWRMNYPRERERLAKAHPDTVTDLLLSPLTDPTFKSVQSGGRPLPNKMHRVNAEGVAIPTIGRFWFLPAEREIAGHTVVLHDPGEGSGMEAQPKYKRLEYIPIYEMKAPDRDSIAGENLRERLLDFAKAATPPDARQS